MYPDQCSNCIDEKGILNKNIHECVIILAFSDWRNHTLDRLIDHIEREELKPDLIVYAGDDIWKNARFSKPQGSNGFERLAQYSTYGVFGVIGNDCKIPHKRYLNGENVYDIHDEVRMVDGFHFIGMEGATGGIGHTLYAEEEVQSHLKDRAKGKRKRIILVSHSPPLGILDFSKRFGDGSIGSSAIRKFIQRKAVILNICGHCHLMGGKKELVDGCWVVNVASNDTRGSKGTFTMIELEDEDCTIGFYEALSDLEMIWGIGEKTALKLDKLGVRTIEHFIATDPEALSEKIRPSAKTISKWQFHGKAIMNKETILKNKLELSDPIFLDIETGYNRSYVWMIGLYDPKTDRFYQFTAHDRSQEQQILSELLDFIRHHEERTLVHYSGINFDINVLKERMIWYEIDPLPIDRSVDFLPSMRRNLILPIRNYKLSTVANHFKFFWKHEDIDGRMAPKVYQEYVETKDETVIKRLQEYNKDDVYALHHIISMIDKMIVNKVYHFEEADDIEQIIVQ